MTTLVVLAGIAYGIYYALVLDHYETTDNAYVQGNVVQLTPQVGGTVVAINADDTDFVKAGQLLVKLDPADARVALDQAEAQLGQTVREVRTLFVNNGALQAQIASREADLARARSEVAKAQDDVTRREPLVRTGAVGKEEFNHVTSALSIAKSAYTAAQSGALAAREQLASNQSLTQGVSIDQHPNVLRAAARVREAYLALSRAELVAPVDGYVARAQRAARPARAGRCAADVGGRAEPGLGRRQLQGEPAAPHPHRPAGRPRGRRLRPPGRLPRHDRRARRRHRRGVRLAAGAERDRQLDQGGPARAGPDRARSEGSRAAIRCGSACRWTRRSTSRIPRAACWPMRRSAA